VNSKSKVFGRRLLAVGALATAGLSVLAANAARVAETPLSGVGADRRLGGPGANGQLRFELGKLGDAKPQIDVALARQALTSSPLSSEPFTGLAALGLLDDPKGKSGKEGALLAEALRRDPRSRAARILLLRNHAAKGELKQAFDQLARLAVLSPKLIEQVMEAITGRITTPRQLDQALDAIAGHDALYLPFVNRMVGKKKSNEVILRLAERLPGQVLARPQIRRAVVTQLVGAGEFQVARKIWQQGLRQPSTGLIHAPNFSDRAAPPPFNWTFAINNTGAVELAKGGGLTIAYYDRAPGPLLSQLLTLPAGAYSARIDYQLLSGTGDNVRLRVECNGTAAPLVEAPLAQRRAGTPPLILRFSIPALGCTGQRIAIVGVATQQRGESQIAVQRIDIAAGVLR
jgi:hypothetical protein